MTSHRRGCVVGVRWIPATGSPGGTAISGYAARRRPGPGPTRLRSGRPANRASTGARGGSAAVAVGSQVKRSAAVRSAVASTSRPATAPSAAISGGRACSGTRPTSPGLSGIAGAGVADRQRHGWPARCGTGRAGPSQVEPGSVTRTPVAGSVTMYSGLSAMTVPAPAAGAAANWAHPGPRPRTRRPGSTHRHRRPRPPSPPDRRRPRRRGG